MPKTMPDMQRRSAVMAGVNEEGRTANATLATEQPVPMWDWERDMVVPEVLLTDGVVFPENRQVPLLDSHNRGSTSDIKGSARDMTANGRTVEGVIHFSKAAEREFQDYRDGHLTDLSVGYRVEKRRYVPAGDTQTIGGRRFTGPVNVVTRWRLHEVSLTPIGADSQAKLRELAPAGVVSLNKLMFKLLTERGLIKADATEEHVRSVLVSRGMPADTEDMVAWVADNDEKLTVTTADNRREDTGFRGQTVVATPQVSVAEEVRKALEAERKARADFRDQVRDLCELAGCEDAAREFAELPTIEEVRKAIKERRAKDQGAHPGSLSGRVSVTADSTDKFREAFGKTIAHRFLAAQGLKDESVKPDASLGHVTPRRIARECVRMMGLNPESMTDSEVIDVAMFPHRLGGDRVRAAGFHITGMFPGIMLDATNKTLLAGYANAPTTYGLWVRTAESVPDFKVITRVRIGQLGLPQRMDDNIPMDQTSVSEEKVSYAIEGYGLEFSFSRKMMINDDTDALSRLPADRGRAMRHFVNYEAYRLLASNPTMPYDNVAFFSDVSGARKSDNLLSGVISETSLGTARLLFRKMLGLNQRDGSAAVPYSPRRLTGLLVPAAIETTARKYLNSEYLPDANTFQVVNQFNNLGLEAEAELDRYSAAEWYGLSDMMGWEITFLQGEEQPRLLEEDDFDTLAKRYKTWQTFAIAPIDHRCMVKSSGS